MTGEKLSSIYVAKMKLIIGQFVHPEEGEGMGQRGWIGSIGI